MKLSAKPIDFKMNEYLNSGYQFLKQNYGNLLLACFFSFIMSLIPLCSFLAVGNFYKYCRGLRKGQQVNPGDVFNFDNFSAYLILQVILIGVMIFSYIPIIIMFPLLAAMDNGMEPSIVFFIFFIGYIFVFYIALVIVSLKGFYICALISLGGITDIKTAWKMSVTMGKGNLLNIFLFGIVVAFLAQLGIFACGFGIFLTLPYLYTSQYFAFEDAIQQIEYDEIKEIGTKNEY